MDGINVEEFCKAIAKITLPISACQTACVVLLLASYRFVYELQKKIAIACRLIDCDRLEVSVV